MGIARALIFSSRTCALEVLAASRDRYRCDYACHLAPIQSVHIDEMEWLGRALVRELRPGPLEFIMGAASRIRRAHPALAPLGYDGERVVGTARGRYVARPESAPGATS